MLQLQLGVHTSDRAQAWDIIVVCGLDYERVLLQLNHVKTIHGRTNLRSIAFFLHSAQESDKWRGFICFESHVALCRCVCIIFKLASGCDPFIAVRLAASHPASSSVHSRAAVNTTRVLVCASCSLPADGHQHPVCCLVDCGSRFFPFVNGNRRDGDRQCSLDAAHRWQSLT